MVNRKSLIPFRVQTGLANSTSATLLVIHIPILLFCDTQCFLSELNDPTGFTCGVQALSYSILLVELGRWFCDIAAQTKFCGFSVSSLYTFSRTARTWLGIAHEGFHRIYGVFRVGPVHIRVKPTCHWRWYAQSACPS